MISSQMLESDVQLSTAYLKQWPISSVSQTWECHPDPSRARFLPGSRFSGGRKAHCASAVWISSTASWFQIPTDHWLPVRGYLVSIFPSQSYLGGVCRKSWEVEESLSSISLGRIVWPEMGRAQEIIRGVYISWPVRLWSKECFRPRDNVSAMVLAGTIIQLRRFQWREFNEGTITQEWAGNQLRNLNVPGTLQPQGHALAISLPAMLPPWYLHDFHLVQVWI